MSDTSNVIVVEHDGKEGQEEKYSRRKEWYEAFFDSIGQRADTSRTHD